MGDLREELEKAFDEEAEHDAAEETAADDASGDLHDQAGSSESKSEPDDRAGEQKAAQEQGQDDEDAGRGKDAESVDQDAPEQSADKDASESQDGKESQIKAEDDESEKSVAEGIPAAPVSWSPAVREHWKDVPAEVRETVLKREHEMTEKLNEVRGEVRIARDLAEVARPYESIMASQGVNPVQAAQNLFQTAGRLTLGTPADKAQTVAEIIKNYNVDIASLDTILSGENPVSPEVNQMSQLLDQRLAPIQQFIGAQQQQYQHQAQDQQDEVQGQIEAFYNDPKHEFVADVSNVMADMLDTAANQGRAMTLEEAYESACYANPEVRKVMLARERAENAGKAKAEIAKKKQAASSVSGTPGGDSSPAGGNSLRGMIETAWDDVAQG